VRVTRVLVVVTCLASLLFFQATAVAASTENEGNPEVAQEETPYVPPEIDVGTPDWLRPFGVLADLPLWAQAAVVSAAIAAAVVVIPTVIRFIWRIASRGRFSNESER
jgi:hypothetical protein